jgi:hypothetical protein
MKAGPRYSHKDSYPTQSERIAFQQGYLNKPLAKKELSEEESKARFDGALARYFDNGGTLLSALAQVKDVLGNEQAEKGNVNRRSQPNEMGVS